MSVKINQSECIGCGKCIKICPGNLIKRNENKKAYLKKSSDCWNCMSCMKECPAEAISLVLSPEIEGKGGRLMIKSRGRCTEWTINKIDGSKVVLVTDTDEANNY